MDRISERVSELFGTGGYYCAETVLAVCAEERGVDPAEYVRLGTGFCSGLARSSGPCGAVTGAVLAVNMLAGREAPEATAASQKQLADNYARVQKLIQGFRERFGSINCTELTRCDLSTDAGRALFAEQCVIEKCRKFVTQAILLVLEVTADLKR